MPMLSGVPGSNWGYTIITNMLNTWLYTIITNILNTVAHLQLQFCKSSQDLFKHPTNKNQHNYLQNHIKSISTWSLSNHQRLNNFLNIRSVVVATHCKGFIAALKACAVAYTVNARFPSVVTQLQNENKVGKFATLATWKHCDATVSGTTSQRWTDSGFSNPNPIRNAVQNPYPNPKTDRVKIQILFKSKVLSLLY